MKNPMIIKSSKNEIFIKLSKPEIVIVPNSLSENNEFTVTVVNESQKFISFQLELDAPGLEDKSDMNWYTVEPEVCTKNPPGSETEFHVSITKPPIPAYNQTVELEVKVFCIEDDKLFNSENIRLRIESPQPKIELKLLSPKIDVVPGKNIEIPVLVTNSGLNFTNVKLQLFANLLTPEVIPLTEVNSEAIPPTKPKVLNIPLKISEKTESGEYEFTIIDVSDDNSYQSNEKDRPYVEGVLNILSHGIIEFKCDNHVQKIPYIENNTENGQTDTVTYELEFINKFDLEEEVVVYTRGKNRKVNEFNKWESITLAPHNQEKKPIVKLQLTEKRPLFGWERQFQFIAKPYCKSNNQVKFQPKTQRLILKVSPKIPFWLQLLGLISIPLLILLLINNFMYRGHNAPVTAVRIKNDLDETVISGSSDRTILRWKFNNNWFGNNSGLKIKGKLKSDISKAVRVIRFLPENDNVVAVGLENGEIHLWNLSPDSEKAMGKPLIEDNDKGNRVFDLGFTKDSQTLIAAYGDGNIKQWDISNIESEIKEPTSSKKAEFTVSTLGISEKDNLPLVVVGGRFNKLGFWDWKNKNKSEIEIYHLPYSEKDINGQQDYITSLTIAQRSNRLITADNQGAIKLWSLKNIRKCIEQSKIPQNDNNQIPKSSYISLSCPQSLLDKKSLLDEEATEKTQTFPSIRSIAITKNESYLASAGDDGNVRIWEIEGDKLSCVDKKPTGQRLNTIDIKLAKKELLIVTGDDKNRVMLYRKNVSEIKNATGCK
ncbi:MAG: hypothetical protein AAGM40_09860 [Cyanobacteria bacterium J06573_2]